MLCQIENHCLLYLYVASQSQGEVKRSINDRNTEMGRTIGTYLGESNVRKGSPPSFVYVLNSCMTS